MTVRQVLLIAVPVAAVSLGCGKSPTQADGTVNITETTSTTSTTTTVIPVLTAGTVGTSPAGTGIASATVYTFLFTTPPAGGIPPYVFAWNFGDGNAGAGNAPSHTYGNTGTFSATVTTTDTRGITVQASVPVSIGSVTGRWIASFDDPSLSREAIDIVQNQTAVTATINDTDNLFGFAAGNGSVSNPRSLSISATFAGLPAPFAVTFVGKLDDQLKTWTGTVTGFPVCPCLFSAIR